MRLILSLLLTLCVLPLYAADLTFRNLNDESHLSGPKLTEDQLKGKVIVVEAWGIRCPICHNIMKESGNLQRELAKDPNVVFIYSHCQQRNNDQILSLLKKYNYTGPVYQAFGVVGAPGFNGIPFAYVYDHKGELVWSGYPANRMSEFSKVIKDAAKAVPKLTPGSLVAGMDIVHNKNVLRALVAGKNVESTLRQLQAKAKRGGEAGEEAQAIIERCETWCTLIEEEISSSLDTTPSKALMSFKLYQRTFPTRARALNAKLAPVAKNQTTARLAAIRQTLEKLRTTRADTPNARKQLLGKVQQQLRALKTLQVNEDDTDYADVEAQLKSFAETLQAQ